MGISTYWNKGKNHEDASEDELIGALGECLVDVVHVSCAGNNLHSHHIEVIRVHRDPPFKVATSINGSR